MHITTRRSVLVHAAVLCGVALCGGCLHWPGPTAPRQLSVLYGGPTGYELVAIPALARVAVYRVAAPGDEAAAGVAGREAIADAIIVAGPALPSGEPLERFSAVLRDDGSYDWAIGDPVGAGFRPAFAVRLAGAKRTLDLLFSRSADEVAAYEGNTRLGSARLGPRSAELLDVLESALRRELGPSTK